jgi:hypothetical protein
MDVEDPAKVVNAAFEDDPDNAKHRMLLKAWHTEYGDKPKRVADLCPDFSESPLRSALQEIAGDRGEINHRSLGRWLERNARRVLGGYVLERVGQRGGYMRWRVVRVEL